MGDENPLIGSTLGHEVAGTVDKLGADVQGWKVGDRALVALILSCGQCRECLAGRDNQCETVSPCDSLAPLSPASASTVGWPTIAVKAHHLDPLGDLDVVAAAPWPTRPSHRSTRSTPSATVSPATRPPWSRPGGLGHMGLQILLATTGSRIIGLDTDAEKLAFAESKGAIAIPSDGEAAGKILELTNGIGADVVFDFVGVQPTVNTALAAVRNGGAIRFVGPAAARSPSRRLRSEPSVGVNIEAPTAARGRRCGRSPWPATARSASRSSATHSTTRCRPSTIYITVASKAGRSWFRKV